MLSLTVKSAASKGRTREVSRTPWEGSRILPVHHRSPKDRLEGASGGKVQKSNLRARRAYFWFEKTQECVESGPARAAKKKFRGARGD